MGVVYLTYNHVTTALQKDLNNSIHGTYCKKSETMPDFVAVKELVQQQVDSYMQMLRSFLGPSVVHWTCLASSSWQ